MTQFVKDYIDRRMTEMGYSNYHVTPITVFVSATSYNIDASGQFYYMFEINSREEFVITSNTNIFDATDFFAIDKKDNFVEEFSGQIKITKATTDKQAFSFIKVIPKV